MNDFSEILQRIMGARGRPGMDGIAGLLSRFKQKPGMMPGGDRGPFMRKPQPMPDGDRSPFMREPGMLPPGVDRPFIGFPGGAPSGSLGTFMPDMPDRISAYMQKPDMPQMAGTLQGVGAGPHLIEQLPPQMSQPDMAFEKPMRYAMEENMMGQPGGGFMDETAAFAGDSPMTQALASMGRGAPQSQQLAALGGVGNQMGGVMGGQMGGLMQAMGAAANQPRPEMSNFGLAEMLAKMGRS